MLSRHRVFIRWLPLIAAGAMAAPIAWAQTNSAGDTSRNTSSSRFVPFDVLDAGTLNRAAAQGASKARSGTTTATSGTSATTLVGDRFNPASTAHLLAQRYNADKRSQIESAYVQAFEGYQKIEAQFGIPKGDLAGGVAAFIAGNYIAYRNQDFPDEQFPPLVAQLRTVLSANPSLAQASVQDKRQTYEQMAMIGMFMATAREALKRKPNPSAEAEIRQTARTNLEQFLKTDADRLQITDQGLVIR